MMQHFPIHCVHTAGMSPCVCLYVCVCVSVPLCMSIRLSVSPYCVYILTCVNAELDWRRLGYLGNSLEEQFELETKLVLMFEDHVMSHVMPSGLNFPYFDQY